MARSERGVSVLFVVMVLLVVAGAALAILALSRTTADVARSGETTARLEKVQAALEQFAATSERLPCPANPAADTGDAAPNAASATCTYPAGSVPWRTIGLRQDDALDAWGWKISYRVYSGAIGLTQAAGASMVHCDTVEPSPAGRDPATGLCRVPPAAGGHNTSEAQFLAGKGLSVSSFGTASTDVAYVLVSHGPSGLGAYTTAGAQKAPNPASTDELANLGATGPFIAKAAVTDVAPESAAFFDDVIAFRRLPDFVKRANLGARDWPESGGGGTLANITFDQATVSAAVGSSVSTGSSTGQASITFTGGATVTGFDSGGTQNVSFETQGGYQGIGGAAGGTMMISSLTAEGLRFQLPAKARQLAVTFANFGRRVGNVREQVEFKFFDGAAVVNTIVGEGCRNEGDPTDDIATFSIDAAADFDRVDVKALPATTDASETAFLFVQFMTCVAGVTCETSLSVPSNRC